MCGIIGFFLGGSVRVFSSGGSGRQITLYEVFPGEICILNATCVLSRRGYPAEAATLEPTECLLVPADAFRRLFASANRCATLSSASLRTVWRS